MPDPFGMRWFGIFTISLVVSFLADWLLPRPLGAVVYAVLLVVVGVGLILLSETSLAVKQWLLAHWRQE